MRGSSGSELLGLIVCGGIGAQEISLLGSTERRVRGRGDSGVSRNRRNAPLSARVRADAGETLEVDAAYNCGAFLVGGILWADRVVRERALVSVRVPGGRITAEL